MSFLTIYETPELSNELSNLLTDIHGNVQAYTQSKTEAQKQRMIIIGKVVEYQRQFPQRSKDHKLLTDAMTAEGWSSSVISRQSIAYREYNRLEGNGVSEYCNVAKLASPNHLYEIASDKGTLGYDSAMYLKRTGSLPSVSAMRSHKAGNYNSKFEPLRKAIPQHKESVVNETQVVEVSPVEVIPYTVEVATLTPEIEVENQVSISVPEAPTTRNPLIDDVYQLHKSIKEFRKKYLSNDVEYRNACYGLLDDIQSELDLLKTMSTR